MENALTQHITITPDLRGGIGTRLTVSDIDRQMAESEAFAAAFQAKNPSRLQAGRTKRCDHRQNQTNADRR